MMLERDFQWCTRFNIENVSGDLGKLVVSLCSGVEGALKDALKALNLGFLSGIIKSLIPCHDLEVTGLLCESNIVLNFPSALNAGNVSMEYICKSLL